MTLTDLRAIKCKTCGEPLDISKAQGGVIKCAVCDSVFTLPKTDASQKVLDYLFQAEGDLDTGRFEDAHVKYSKAAELDKTEPEAYWGMALAEFKIQYLKDEVNNRLQPICHDINDKDFADSPYFLKALRYATEAQRAEYERKAEEINYIKNEFYKIAKTGVKYDCFICVKVSAEDGGRTQDYKIADDIYFELKGKGYRPFFSERELVGVTGADYEARILYALKSSECMLVVCFDEAYLRTKWVKNEYTRFLKLVNDEEKESDSIALVFGDRPVEKLPGKKGKIQGIALNSLTAMERIVSFVDAHTPEARKRREEAQRKREEDAKRKAQEDEAQRKKFAEQEERLRQQEERFKQLEEMLKAQQNAFAAKSVPAQFTAPQPAAVHQSNPNDFEIRDGVLRRYRGTAPQIAIPNWVTSIGRRAFYGHNELSSIIIPEGVTDIGEGAFSECKGLMSIAIPSSVKSIADGAFYGCSGLTNIELPEGLESIADGDVFMGAGGVFGYCKRLTGITIPSSVKRIGQWAFRSCENLKVITIKNGVTSIGEYAFNGCNSLKQIIIPESVDKVGRGILYGTDSATLYCRSDSQPSGWNKDWNEMATGTKHKVVWDYSDGLTEKEELARQEKNRQVKEIREREERERGKAFGKLVADFRQIAQKRAKEEEERIEREKREAEERARIKAEKERKEKERLERERAEAEEKARIERERAQAEKARQEKLREERKWASHGFSISNGELDNYFGTATDIAVPSCVTSIGKGAFFSVKNLKSVSIPSSVKSIGVNAFHGCSELTKINIPNSVTEIGNGAFSICKKLTKIDIPNSVTEIGEQAFWWCEGLQQVTIPGSVKSIGNSAFSDCRKLSSLTLQEGVESIGELAFGDCSELKNLTIPSSIKSIGQLAFHYCRGLKNIFIPSGVTDIGGQVFSSCPNIESISVVPDNPNYKSVNNCLLTKDGTTLINGCKNSVIPESVKKINYGAFAGCSDLKNIVIPNGVTSIEDGAFAVCKSLKQIVIPEGVTTMGEDVFTYSHIKIYCRAASQPKGWHPDWNAMEARIIRKDKKKVARHKVKWGYKGN